MVLMYDCWDRVGLTERYVSATWAPPILVRSPDNCAQSVRGSCTMHDSLLLQSKNMPCHAVLAEVDASRQDVISKRSSNQYRIIHFLKYFLHNLFSLS